MLQLLCIQEQKDWYYDQIRKLSDLWRKVIESDGLYFEELFNFRYMYFFFFFFLIKFCYSVVAKTFDSTKYVIKNTG
jgi:hypothetical protein